MLLYHSFMSKLALMIFVSSALLALFIGKYKVPEVNKKTQLARVINLGLWGFVPTHITEVMHQRNVWNWRKLLVCGMC